MMCEHLVGLMFINNLTQDIHNRYKYWFECSVNYFASVQTFSKAIEVIDHYLHRQLIPSLSRMFADNH